MYQSRVRPVVKAIVGKVVTKKIQVSSRTSRDDACDSSQGGQKEVIAGQAVGSIREWDEELVGGRGNMLD